MASLQDGKGTDWYPDFCGAFIFKDQRRAATRAEATACEGSRLVIAGLSLSEGEIGSQELKTRLEHASGTLAARLQWQKLPRTGDVLTR
jgi:hypothetical protein